MKKKNYIRFSVGIYNKVVYFHKYTADNEDYVFTIKENDEILVEVLSK